MKPAPSSLDTLSTAFGETKMLEVKEKGRSMLAAQVAGRVLWNPKVRKALDLKKYVYNLFRIRQQHTYLI